jgi:FAD:protein FMN transferase
MGTMFDIVAFDARRDEAAQAMERALDEVGRLDRVLSHFKTDSGLSRLMREGRGRLVRVDPALYEVLALSLAVSKRSGGVFDVTIAPLLRAWKAAYEGDRNPTAAEIAEAGRCVGYGFVELEAPDRVRLRSDCVEIDLGGIGKGYAVDRAIAVLEAAGIRDAIVNAGTSSIAAMGSGPGGKGWPVRLGWQEESLRDSAFSTSQQAYVNAPALLGETMDPRTGAPAENRFAVSVMASNAALSDALSTTLLILPVDEGKKMLAQYPGVSAAWVSRQGQVVHVYGKIRPSIHPSDGSESAAW